MSDTPETPKRIRWRPRIVKKKIESNPVSQEEKVISKPVETQKPEPVINKVVSKRRKSSLLSNPVQEDKENDISSIHKNSEKAPFQAKKDWPEFNWTGSQINPSRRYKASPPGVTESKPNPTNAVDIKPEGYIRPLRKINTSQKEVIPSVTVKKPDSIYQDVLLPMTPPPPAGGSYMAILEWLASAYPEEELDFSMYEDENIQNVATRLWLGELYDEIVLPRIKYEERHKVKNNIFENTF